MTVKIKKWIKRYTLYIFTIIYLPLTLIKLIVSFVLLADLWCDKTIDIWINEADRE